MMKNASAAECIRACVKNGSDLALLSGDKLYPPQGRQVLFDKWAGQTVTVQGKVSGTTITVDAMTEK